MDGLWFGLGLDLSLHLGKAMQVLIPSTAANVIAATAPAPQGGPNVAFHAFLSEAAGKGAEESSSMPTLGEGGGARSDGAGSRDRADRKRADTDSSGAGPTVAAPVLLAVAVPTTVQQQQAATSGIPEGVSGTSTASEAVAAMPGIVNNIAGSDIGATQSMPAVAGQVMGGATGGGVTAVGLTGTTASGVLPAAGAADLSSTASKQTGVMMPMTGNDGAGTEAASADSGAVLLSSSTPQQNAAAAGSVPSAQGSNVVANDSAPRGHSLAQAKAAATLTSPAVDKSDAATATDSQNTQTQKSDSPVPEKQAVALAPAMPPMTMPVPDTSAAAGDVPPAVQDSTGVQGTAGIDGLQGMGKKAAGANRGTSGPAMSLSGISPDDQGASIQTAHGVIPTMRQGTGRNDAEASAQQDASQSAAAVTMPASATHGNGGDTAASVVPDSAAASPAVVPDGAMATHVPAINSARLIQKMNESEMRVGMQTAEFGNISVRTSMVHEQLAAQISVDHAELGRAMSQHLPSMQARLGEEYGLNARIEIRDGGTSYTSDADRGSRGGQQESNPRGGFQRFQTGAVMATGSSVAPLSSISSDSARLDVRI